MTRRRPMSVLLVDYIRDEREMYGIALRSEGFAVTHCGDPNGALAEAIARPPHVVITRVLQPGFDVNGIELTRQLKAHPRTRRALVFIITSRMEAAYRDAAREAGCDGYFLLPCTPEELISEIRARSLRQPSRPVMPG